MTKPTTLLLARHGETVDNAAQVMQGQTPGCLSDRGRQQAEQLADRLAHYAIDAIVASDLRRSVQTARILAARLAPPPSLTARHDFVVSLTPLLRERDWGSFTGRYIPDLQGLPIPDDVESLDCLLQRAQRFLEYIMTNYEGQTVLAVGHGIINKAIQAAFFRKPMNQVERMSNCEVRILHLSASSEVPVAASTVVAASASASYAASTEVSASAVAAASASDVAAAE